LPFVSSMRLFYNLFLSQDTSDCSSAATGISILRGMQVGATGEAERESAQDRIWTALFEDSAWGGVRSHRAHVPIPAAPWCDGGFFEKSIHSKEKLP
jgi:hypothetical protein